MAQDAIQEPKVKPGPNRAVLQALYLHVGASLLRNLVWLMSGDGKDFDDIVTIKTPGLGDGQVRIAICRPHGARSMQKGERTPLVMVLEGGGFVLGQPEDGQKHDRKIAEETGAVVISIDYAKAPRHPYPHALLQIYEVLKWAFTPAAQSQGLDIDPRRVAVMGNSAGGNLTAALSLLLSFSNGPCARFRNALPNDFRQVKQILIYPSVECNALYRTRFQRAEAAVQAKSLPVGIAELMESSYLPPHIDKEQIFIAPLLTESGLLKELKPASALVLTAGLDCLKKEADVYARKLREAGVNVEEHDYPEAIHGFSHYTKGKDFRVVDVEDCWKRIAGVLTDAFESGSNN
ncbi:hypothetical protein PMZ80_001901 [Knufia obscura]|uniref:Alpha/beta hydrolase fold-3 domain-containing protein n=2 Tax=Knufia TaxID=430999 RepID=A0AAN8I930_9EURO|nr:hypothetical protein PMZ80_001901 [Knufia obscura]KAK5953720.1 hypothetical protein OHC33_004989 [Knufia fluminis]